MGTYKPYKAYSFVRTIWKVVKAAGILGAGATAAVVFPEANAGPEQWCLFLATLTPPIIEGVRNYQKNKD